MTARTAPGGVLIASGPWDPRPWAAPIRDAEPDRPLAIWPDLREPEEIRYLLAWKPPAEALAGLPNLEAIFSLGAGVDHLIGSGPLPEVPIVRVVDPDLTGRMVEWAVFQVLLHHRQHLKYATQQRRRHWRELRQPPAGAVRIGILGFGELGRAAAAALAGLGFDVAGWSRRPKTSAGIAAFYGEDGLSPFLARTDILVALLPLTPATRGILDYRLFAGLARDGALGGPVLINGGRGGLQVEADILRALDDGTLAAASLDVFETEPLPAGHPFWERANLVLTPHAAAASDADVLARSIYRQIVDFEAGRGLRNIVDRDLFY